MEQKTKIHCFVIYLLGKNKMNKMNIVLSNILCKKKAKKNKKTKKRKQKKNKKTKKKEAKKSKTHNVFFQYFILCTQSRFLIAMLWCIGLKLHAHECYTGY